MKKYSRLIISLTIGIAVFLFWAFPFRAALNYHEEFQLFLIDDDYMLSHLQEAGGMAVYLSEALVQFYNNFWIGAGILGVEFMLIYLLSASIIKKLPSFKGNYLLPLIPVAVLWILIGDYNVMHSLIMAVLLVLLFIYIVLCVCKTLPTRAVGLVVVLPMLWWMCWTSHYRYPGFFAKMDTIYNSNVYDVLEYDMYVRANKWDEIIKKAVEQIPNSPNTVCATNLALGMQQRLLTHGQKFNRYGVDGLLPKFDHNPFLTLTIAETFLQLGMVNSAQRMYFEAMEAIHNRNKSTRCIRRLAETNIVNGHYEVAKKYLRLLEKTVFYRNWARRTMKLIDCGEAAIESNRLYKHMRAVSLEQDFLYNDVELIDRVFGYLFVHNPNNYMAMQYLMFYAALEGNVEKYQAYYNVVKKYRPNAEIPKLKTSPNSSNR